MVLNSISNFRPLRTSSRAMAPNFEPDVQASDTVAISPSRPHLLPKRQQWKIAIMAALAITCLPAGSAILTNPAAPISYEVPADSWAAGVPGRDLVQTRMEGIQFSLQSGKLTHQQADQLRLKLQNLPASGPELINRLTRFDNLYDDYRLPSDPPAAAGAAPAQPVDSAISNLLHQGFQLYDRNGDRAVSRGELTRALTTIEDGRLGAPASAMSAMYGELAGNLNYIPFSALDNPTLARYTDVSLQRQANQPEIQPLSQETFNSSRIRQRFQGSCVLLSTMLELPPQQLRQMITDNQDGTFTVRFRNGKQATVSDVTEAERSFFSTTFEGERWPALFEKAVGAVRASEGVGGGDLIAAGRTIPPSEAMALMTGRSAEFRHIVALGPSGLRQFLIEAQRNHEPIIAGISRTDGRTGLIGHHEYSVQDFDARTNMVTLRNPHGSGVWNGSRLNQNGLFEMPLSEFYHHYHNITALKDQAG